MHRLIGFNATSISVYEIYEWTEPFIGARISTSLISFRICVAN